jgi:hypothetical protein
VRPRDCPRWDGCSAPVCPLETDWRRCDHLDGERVCSLLSELVKGGGEARLRGVLPTTLVDTLMVVAPMVSARYNRIHRALERASRSSSRMEAGQLLARCAGGAMQGAGLTRVNAPALQRCEGQPVFPARPDPIAKAGA